ncbi:MAG: XRE family transcriptional regulator [Sphingobacteriales bacterium]|nr:MAG: XRE family transcriptional regulator [Sphingobacteriales bacterium]
MAKSGKSSFEWEIIEKVKAVRLQKGLSQFDIASILGTSSSFIGQVEVMNHSSKYNLDHLNKLAYEWKCSPKDFIPQDAMPEEGWEAF